MSSAIPKKSVKQLHPQLLEKLTSLRASRNFKPEEWVENRVKGFLTYMKRNNLTTAVVSMSGGVDSSCIAAILKRAQDVALTIPDHPFSIQNGGRIVGIAQPFHSTPEIQNRAYEVGRDIGVEVILVDRTPEYDVSVEKVERAIKGELKGFSKAMLKSYERTPINYLLASHYGGVVIGTGNKDEDGYLFYYCKFGDGAVDVGLIWDLHKSEVFQVAKYLNVPESVLVAPPSADLAPGQTDEEEIGATYDAVEYVTSYLSLSPIERIHETADLCEEAASQFYYELDLIESIHRKGLHKADLNPKNIGSGWFNQNYGSGVSTATIDNATSGEKEASLSIQSARAIRAYLSWSESQQQSYVRFLSSEDNTEFKSQLALYLSIQELMK